MCDAIPAEDLARLAAVAEVRNYEKGKIFIEEGRPAEAFFNVTVGTIKLFKLLPDGRQQVTGFAGIGHFLGLAVSETYAFSAQAIENVRVCRFSRSRLRRLITDFPSLEQRLLATACNELATAQEHILLLGRKTAQERVASFLISWMRTPPCDTRSNHVHLPMTRTDIADHLGLTIETVSRTLSRFRALGWIRISAPAEVVIVDRSHLQELAECSTL